MPARLGASLPPRASSSPAPRPPPPALRPLPSAPQDESVTQAYLHVQTSNEDAIRFYARYGFKVVEEIKNYYKRIDPPDCYVLCKQLRDEARWAG